MSEAFYQELTDFSHAPKASMEHPYQIKGWVDAVRSHGKLVFVDVRNHQHVVIQCVARGMLKDLHPEDVVCLCGKFVQRPEKMVNPNIPTGTVEFVVEKAEVLNKAGELPIPVEGEGYEIGEDKRLKYRYLDLRRKRLNKNIRIRSRMLHDITHLLDQYGWLQIETPILTQSTKEGARDFVVPSRFHPGQVYALPQSPQQYKQLLMTAGFENYYQIARCVRDETLRADRGFEFTQLDMEMSFATEAKIFYHIENVVRYVVGRAGKKTNEVVGYLDTITDSRRHFPVLHYKEAMEKYGTDKPDIRTQQEKDDGTLAFCWVVRFPMFKAAKEEVDKLDSKSAWTFMHNPFSMPVKEHLEQHLRGVDPEQIESYQYDLVCNGLEIGSGSIRAHRRDILTATFKVMGYTDAQIEESVGHMLDAFDLGTPPHGGIALGLDRLAMLLCGEESMKEVVAFPMTGTGRVAVMNAPTPLTQEQLKELGLRVVQ